MTRINYPDIVVYSSGRKCRLEIHSPDNDPITPRPIASLPERSPRRGWGGFQSDFQYCAYDAQNGRILWKGDLGDHPHEAWMSDEGWAVVRTHHTFGAGLFVISPTGEKVLKLDLLRDVFDETEEHVEWTSAGPFWARSSLAYFITVGGQQHWCIRTWWGRRILINLPAARLTSENDADTRLLAMTEAGLVIDALRAGVSQASCWNNLAYIDGNSGLSAWWDKWRDRIRAVQSAAFLAGRLSLERAPELLRRLEPTNVWSSISFDSSIPARVYSFSLRRAVQLSLRRLNHEPARLPAYLFQREDGSAVPVPERTDSRERAVVTPRMSPLEVLQLKGMPDYLEQDEWNYDVGLRSGCTTRIAWKCAGGSAPRIGSIQQIVPPVWRTSDERDYGLLI